MRGFVYIIVISLKIENFKESGEVCSGLAPLSISHNIHLVKIIIME